MPGRITKASDWMRARTMEPPSRRDGTSPRPIPAEECPIDVADAEYPDARLAAAYRVVARRLQGTSSGMGAPGTGHGQGWSGQPDRTRSTDPCATPVPLPQAAC
jgi:hypothetical protein